MKLPPGFPVKLGMCASTYYCVPVRELSLRGTIAKHVSSFCFLPRRHPRLPHDHSNCHISRIPLRRFWGVNFLHPCWLQRRSQSFSRPLTCKHEQKMSSQWICFGGGKQKWGILWCYTPIYRYIYKSIYIYILHFKKKKGNWSYWSVDVHFADGSKANQCKQMLEHISLTIAHRQSFLWDEW